MKLTHFNEQGRARMVDVSEKAQTYRVARAAATVRMAKATMDKIKEGSIGKGDVLAVAQVAGIMAAKKNSELIPMCHPLLLTKVDISFEIEETALHIRSEVRCHGETGVEMEALTDQPKAIVVTDGKKAYLSPISPRTLLRRADAGGDAPFAGTGLKRQEKEGSS